MMSRTAGRQRELAVRSALGARRVDLLSQMLAESTLLSIIGAALGILLAQAGIQSLLALKPADILRPEQIRVSLPVLFFTAGLSIACALIFGLIPGLQILRSDANLALCGAAGGRFTWGSNRLRKALIVSEVGVSVVLLLGAAFMLKSLFAVMKVDPGSRPDHLLTMRLNLPPSRYSNNAQAALFCREALQRVSTLTSVKSASFSDGLAMTRIRLMKFTIEGLPAPKPGGEPTADMRGITSPAYLSTLGLAIINGRNFTADEVDQSRPVIIVNQSLARKLWPHEDPVGKRLRAAAPKPGGEPLWLTVNGVVSDTKQLSLEGNTRPEIIRPMVDYTVLTLAIRTSLEPASVTNAVQRQIWSLDKDLPLFNITTMEEIVKDNMGQRRFNSLLMTAFAAVALILAALGIYGVLSSAVAQRTREIGIRMALGAGQENVTRMVLAQGFRLIATGALCGLVVGIALIGLLSTLLFGVSLTHIGTYVEVLATLFAVGLIACYIPAMRAVRVDPMIALRQE
jgi:putative ABC transport system permease protein